MQFTRRNAVAVLTTACVSLAVAAPGALADQPSTSPKGPKPTQTAPPVTPPAPETPAETPTPAEKRKGYGVLCKGQSKKHVPGQKGTPFSQCVNALAKVDRGETASPKKACKALSKKHVKGQKGTPYSRCVVAAAKQREKTEAAEQASESAAPAQS